MFVLEMDDDDRPSARVDEPDLGAASLLAGESLDRYSLTELDGRVSLLEDEIARVKAHRAKAADHMSAADALFRPKTP